MRLRRFLIAGLFAAIATLSAQAPARVDVDRLMMAVRTLASPLMEGRRSGTAGGRLARQYVRDAFADIGLQPAGAGDRAKPSGYEQRFSFTSSGFHSPATKGSAPIRVEDAANVVGRIAGHERSSRVIVVSAHYDHDGVVNGTLYPGADDNASGVAALLECARYLRAHPPRHTFLFAAFDAEELGLQGARAFVRMPPVPLTSILLDINFDMVSRNDRHEIYAAGTAHYPSLKPILEDVQRRAAVKLLFGHDGPSAAHQTDDWTMESDHGVFHEAHVPFVYFGVEDHPDYHQPTDTPDKIDPAFFGRVVEMLLDAVVTFDQRLR
jgi:Zn-dependent M28 family amino/carboxypeptidase